jgi:hypothetical protein
LVKMGYGSRALQALNAFYSGEYFNFDADAEMGEGGSGKVSRRKGVDAQEVSFFPLISPWPSGADDVVGVGSYDGDTDGESGIVYAPSPSTTFGAETGEPGLPWRELWVNA